MLLFFSELEASHPIVCRYLCIEPFVLFVEGLYDFLAA